MVEQNLKAALASKEKVTIPGFGTFSTELEPASLHQEKGIFSPPHKTVRFVDEIGYSDHESSLINFLADKNGIDPDEAESEVQQFITAVKEAVRNEEEYNIEGLGYFHKGLYGNTDFTPYQEANLLPDSFGLPMLSVSNLPMTVRQPVEEEEHDTGGSKVLLVLVPVMLLVVAAIFIFFNASVRQKVIGIFGAGTPVAEQPAQNPDGTQENATGTLTENEALSEETTAAQEAPEEQEEEVQTAPVNQTAPAGNNGGADIVETRDGRWYLSVASFTNLALAKEDAQEARSKGYTEAKVVVAGTDKYRVSIADFSSKADADSKAASSKADYSSIWVFKF